MYGVEPMHVLKAKRCYARPVTRADRHPKVGLGKTWLLRRVARAVYSLVVAIHVEHSSSIVGVEFVAG